MSGAFSFGFSGDDIDADNEVEQQHEALAPSGEALELQNVPAQKLDVDNLVGCSSSLLSVNLLL